MHEDPSTYKKKANGEKRKLNMNPEDLERKLKHLMGFPAEVEWLEFKEAKNNYDNDKLGKFFSALSNEANLKKQECGWLIFGITDKPARQIVGTQFRPNRPRLDQLKKEIADHTSERLTFVDIHELEIEGKRVLMFHIPPALQGIPTSWKGHYYGRDGESIGALNLSEIELIRNQENFEDWSAKICMDAVQNDLDPEAILFARQQYKEKFPKQAEELKTWDNLTFLNKAKVCIDGKITYTALVLLGKSESQHFLSPSVAQITWVLRDDSDIEKDYQHFYPPMILAVDKLFSKIRNLTYRYMPNTTLFPTEITQYDPWVIRETLHNCIAHQDYTLKGRINVVEESDSLLFTNLGHFIPGSIEEVLRRDAPPEKYRNPFLSQAMVNLNMIDTIGSGIKRMFETQRKRFFPMPDYDLRESERVKVRLIGEVLDENYTRILIEKAYLSLMDVLALDKVQKKHPITDEEFQRLKAQKLIEGRRPKNLYVSAKVAAVTGDKAAYIKHRAFDKNHYKQLIISYLERFSTAKREDIEKLLLNKFSDVLTEEQKMHQVRNLLQEMRKEGTIERIGSKKTAKWVLSKKREGSVFETKL